MSPVQNLNSRMRSCLAVAPVNEETVSQTPSNLGRSLYGFQEENRKPSATACDLAVTRIGYAEL
jgi:hypothetical protein